MAAVISSKLSKQFTQNSANYHIGNSNFSNELYSIKTQAQQKTSFSGSSHQNLNKNDNNNSNNYANLNNSNHNLNQNNKNSKLLVINIGDKGASLNDTYYDTSKPNIDKPSDKKSVASYKLSTKKALFEKRRKISDFALFFALFGLLLMIVHCEMSLNDIYDDVRFKKI